MIPAQYSYTPLRKCLKGVFTRVQGEGGVVALRGEKTVKRRRAEGRWHQGKETVSNQPLRTRLPRLI